MATKLEKDLVRESTVLVDDRNIMVTISADQKIKFKLKGLKTGEVSIDIEQLYKDLAGISDEVKKPSGPVTYKRQEKSTKANPMISLYDLRSKSAISNLPHEYKAKFDGIVVGLIKEMQR